VRDDLDLAIAALPDLDRVAQVADAAINLDPVMQELLEGRDVEDLVVDGLRGVDDVLLRNLLLLSLRSTGSIGSHRDDVDRKPRRREK